MYKQESGRSMVEMLGVLAIIGVISAGALSGIGYGMQSYRATSAFQLVEDTVQGVVDLYSWSRTLPETKDAGSMKTRICENDVFDDTCIADEANAAVATSFGKLIVKPNSVSDFKIELTSVPENICNRLADMTWSENIEWESPGSASNPACNGTQSIVFTAY